MNNDTKQVFLKVSTDGTPTLSDSSKWIGYVTSIPVSGTETIDFPTLGVDANGIYFSVQIKDGSSNRGFRIRAFKKPDVYGGSYSDPPPILGLIAPAELDTWAIQPASNFDASPLGGYTWFVAKGPSNGTEGGQLLFRRLEWNGALPRWVLNESWSPIPGSYRNYYDIPQGVRTPAPKGNGGSVDLGQTGSRLMMAVIRTRTGERTPYLWTCHHVGLDTAGGYNGNPNAVNRSGVQWFKLALSTSGLSYSTHDRIYDAAPSTPYWYYFPSLNVNAGGDMLIAFSGSRSGEHIGAFFRGRRADGTWMARLGLVQAGRATLVGNERAESSASPGQVHCCSTSAIRIVGLTAI